MHLLLTLNLLLLAVGDHGGLDLMSLVFGRAANVAGGIMTTVRHAFVSKEMRGCNVFPEKGQYRERRRWLSLRLPVIVLIIVQVLQGHFVELPPLRAPRTLDAQLLIMCALVRHLLVLLTVLDIASLGVTSLFLGNATNVAGDTSVNSHC